LAASTSGAPLDASVGEALEEFLQYAQQLKQRAAGAGASACSAWQTVTYAAA